MWFQLQFDFKGSNKMHLLIFLLQVATSPLVEQRRETGMVIWSTIKKVDKVLLNKFDSEQESLTHLLLAACVK